MGFPDKAKDLLAKNADIIDKVQEAAKKAVDQRKQQN
ncbi:Uncharacterised protein [Mycobacterium xenopi]|uniref:Uncharacterized protein n=1 Tax=Mycobacterium xenopi TaxID=1789 RepID=A0AAD1GXW6_MYCXE|nr:hypothetical protein MYXE_12070 [Mycobacterium xenopi]SPX78693.1 Uncharacterised protein [Mycobacterium xenopi]